MPSRPGFEARRVSTFEESLSKSYVAPGSGVVAITGTSSNRADGTELASATGAATPPPKTATKAAPDKTNSTVSDRTCFRIDIGMTYSGETDNAQRMIPEAHKTKDAFPIFHRKSKSSAITDFLAWEQHGTVICVDILHECRNTATITVGRPSASRTLSAGANT